MIADVAIEDIEGIAEYISFDLQEPNTSFTQILDIKKSIMSLEMMPERHREVSDKHLQLKGIRMMPVNNYIVFYTVSKEDWVVNIVRVLHSKRKWEFLLQK